MKVVCVNNISKSLFDDGFVKTDLIIGKIYEVEKTGLDYYEIKTNDPEVYAAFYYDPSKNGNIYKIIYDFVKIEFKS